MKLVVFSLALLFSSVYGTDLAVLNGKTTYCAVQVSVSYPTAARSILTTIKQKSVEIVQGECEEFSTCYPPRYAASSCHTSFVQGVKRGGCYLDMMFFCTPASKVYKQCKNIDTSTLIGYKMKLAKRSNAVITDVVVTKSAADVQVAI